MTQRDLLKSLETMIYFKDTAISEKIMLPDGNALIVSVLKGTTTFKVTVLDTGETELYDSIELAYDALQSRLNLQELV